VLERGEVANTWRTERWDGFHLNTPKFSQQLPGLEYAGPEPDAFSSLAETLAYFDEYASLIDAPLRTGITVTALRPVDGLLRLSLGEDAIDARHVVVATGAYQKPAPTPLAASVPEDVLQLTTSSYRRPEDLPAGAVLVVGGGQSGCQIADELLGAGRRVYLSTGRCPWAPRRYRGREILHWLVESGFMDQTVDTLPSPAARLPCNPPISGNDGGHDCHPRWLAERGATVVGRLEGVEDGTARFANDLEASLAWGEDRQAEILARLDAFIDENGFDAPAPDPVEARPLPPVDAIHLRDADVGSILWANGFRPDFGWIDLPLFDDLGWPLQTRGVAKHPGLYFVGLHWLHKRKSSLLFGVGEDAEHVAARIARSEWPTYAFPAPAPAKPAPPLSGGSVEPTPLRSRTGRPRARGPAPRRPLGRAEEPW